MPPTDLRPARPRARRGPLPVRRTTRRARLVPPQLQPPGTHRPQVREAARTGRPRRAPAPARCPARPPRPVRRPPGSPVASAVSWHSSSLRTPPPTTCTTDTSRGPRAPTPAGPPGGTRARASRGCSAPSRACDCGGVCPVRTASAAMRAGMSPGGRNTGSSMSTTVRQGRDPGGRRRAARAGPRQAGLVPGADRLLQHPQAHDVAQVPDRAVDAGLVGEVRRAARPR